MCNTVIKTHTKCAKPKSDRHTYYVDVMCYEAQHREVDAGEDKWCAKLNEAHPHYEVPSAIFEFEAQLMCPTCNGLRYYF